MEQMSFWFLKIVILSLVNHNSKNKKMKVEKNEKERSNYFSCYFIIHLNSQGKLSAITRSFISQWAFVVFILVLFLLRNPVQSQGNSK